LRGNVIADVNMCSTWNTPDFSVVTIDFEHLSHPIDPVKHKSVSNVRGQEGRDCFASESVTNRFQPGTSWWVRTDGNHRMRPEVRKRWLVRLSSVTWHRFKTSQLPDGGSVMVWCVPSATDALCFCWRQNDVVSVGMLVTSLFDTFLYVRQLWRLSRHDQTFRCLAIAVALWQISDRWCRIIERDGAMGRRNWEQRGEMYCIGQRSLKLWQLLLTYWLPNTY
jgi:hypothetical protein